LYQWAEAVQYQNGTSNLTSPNPAFTGNVRGLCPAGWHLPSDVEWTTLENTLGGANTAGIALKSTNLWQTSVGTQGTNSSGFSALPGGYRYTDGTFNYIGNYSYFWSSSESSFSSTFAILRYLFYTVSTFYPYDYPKYYGLSARCLKD
jgi:uncharacterized protein (TIGR02145 family)